MKSLSISSQAAPVLISKYLSTHSLTLDIILMSGINEDAQVEARRRYVDAFNTTMMRIWREKVRLLGVIDTGMLLKSLDGRSAKRSADKRYFMVKLEQQFAEWGLWSNYGVGKEVYRGNHGDIGREKRREAKVWFSRKYYSSVLNLRDFMADSIGYEFIGIMSDVFDEKNLRRKHG